LIVRFYGLFSIKSDRDGKEILFIIMANLFDTPLKIHEQYDLKGSTVNRSVTLEIPDSNVALKDLDFHRRISIGTKRKSLLLQQAEVDAKVEKKKIKCYHTLLTIFFKFFEGLNICDYSLLIGFHLGSMPGTKLSPHRRKDRSIFRRYHSGMIEKTKGGKRGKDIYFLGIIDVLTQYDFKKKGEHVLKSFLHNKVQKEQSSYLILFSLE